MIIDEGAFEVALHKHMLALTPLWDTEKPGITFKPDPEKPWQRGTLLMPRPQKVAFGHGAYSRVSPIFQIDLFYPMKEQRTGPLYARAAAMKAHFFPAHRRGLMIETSNGQIFVDELPTVVPRLINESPTHNRVIVEIHFTADDCPA